MRKLIHFKPSLVTREFFPEYKDVSVINEGECFIWAYYAFLLFRDVELWSVNCHAFVKHHGRFYDSEVLRGSPDWQDLPATEGAYGRPCKHTVPHFKKYWGGPWNRKKIGSWKAIEKMAGKILRHAQTTR